MRHMEVSDMDNTVLKKRLNTFKSAKGTLRQVSDDVVIDVLRSWENWPGSSADLYRDLGISKMQLVTMIQKAKRLVKSGVVTESEFKELHTTLGSQSGSNAAGSIELAWGNDKVIRFAQVELLIEFLKKVA
jgi:hypothetical protein